MYKLPQTFTNEQVAKLQNILPEDESNYEQMGADSGTLPVRISEERFMYYLEVLPPYKWRHTKYEETFYVMEALTDGASGMLYTWCVRIDKKYYALASESNHTHSQLVAYVRDCINSAYKQSVPANLWDEYSIYAAQAAKLGWNLKSFEEWLNS